MDYDLTDGVELFSWNEVPTSKGIYYEGYLENGTPHLTDLVSFDMYKEGKHYIECVDGVLYLLH